MDYSDKKTCEASISGETLTTRDSTLITLSTGKSCPSSTEGSKAGHGYRPVFSLSKSGCNMSTIEIKLPSSCSVQTIKAMKRAQARTRHCHQGAIRAIDQGNKVAGSKSYMLRRELSVRSSPEATRTSMGGRRSHSHRTKQALSTTVPIGQIVGAIRKDIERRDKSLEEASALCQEIVNEDVDALRKKWARELEQLTLRQSTGKNCCSKPRHRSTRRGTERSLRICRIASQAA